MDDSFVQVNFTTKPCRRNQYDRGKFNVPANTVLDVWVSIKKTILFKDLNYDKALYHRDTSGDVQNYVYYFRKDAGIGIGTAILDAQGNEYVGQIDYRPAEKLAVKFACS